MLIECKLHRPGGTVVELFGRSYHFQPDAFGRHICDVPDDRAAQRLLEIDEAYVRAAARAAGAPLAKPAAPKPPALPNDVPSGASLNIDQMNRVEMLAYAKRLGIRMAGNLSDEKMRLNLTLALRERLEVEAEAPIEASAVPGEAAPADAPADADVADLT